MTDFQPLAELLKTGDEAQARRVLTALPELEYEMLRKPLADEVGIRPAALDKLRALKADNAALQGQSLILDDPEPSPDPQVGAQLLDDVGNQVRRFLVADESSIIGITLWTAWAYIVDLAPVAPNLVASSPVKACGKSTLLDIVARLTPRALSVSGISPAAVFRTIEAMKPTLIIDEADSIFKENDDLRTLLNGGFTRTAARVARVVGDDFEVRLFSTWGAKALALIGHLPDTLASRSVIIPMRRKKADEKTDRLRSDIDQGFMELRSRLARWTLDNGEKIVELDPDIPASLNDRQSDCWRELLRVADRAGGEWPSRSRLAAVQICGRADDEEGDPSTRLLLDLKMLFDTEPFKTSWPSSRIVDYLNELEGSPWPEYAYGKGMDANRLAKLLGRFDIKSKNVAQGDKRLKGYETVIFNDVFTRYLPATRTAATDQNKAIQNNDLTSIGKVAVADTNRYYTDAQKESSGTEALPLPEPLPGKYIQVFELHNIVATERLKPEPDGKDSLALLDGLFDEEARA